MMRTAIVTGGSRGIGRAVAESQAAEGTRVVINYLRNGEAADEVVRGIRSRGGEAIAVRGDVGKLAELRALFQTTISQFETVDVLVNCAGIIKNEPIERVTEESFDRHFATNVKGTYFAAQLAASHMEHGGRIVNFSSSVLGRVAANWSIYAATKGAVEQLTRQLAPEFATRRITINAVAPGPVATEMLSSLSPPPATPAARSATVPPRLARPEDIARVVLFLTSEAAGWITGQTIRVNGGFA
jgi:3-oxoacyl-[acyl-carrier protein] reductase